MSKRNRDRFDGDRLSKRICSSHRDHFSNLSDELVLRVLSYLSVSDRVRSLRLSHRLKSLADDPQLWKSAYYSRFVRPRASRIPGLRDHVPSAKALHYSSKLSKWLQDSHLVRGGKTTDWKKQYKLRHNWSRGSCNVSQTKIAERPSTPPLLVRLHEKFVITVDVAQGLRVWSMNGEPKLLAAVPSVPEDESQDGVCTPTSLAVDALMGGEQEFSIAIGFSDGRFGVFNFDNSRSALSLQYMHAPSSNGTISAIAYASPYLLTMTESQLLSLYMFCPFVPSASRADNSTAEAPRLLSSLKSHTAWPPLSLSIRASPTSIFASIAYAMPTYLAGWSVGLQEMLLTVDGSIVESRLASAQPQGFYPLSLPSEESRSTSPSIQASTSPLRNRAQIETSANPSKPIYLSYTHPYLLAAHADNTLSLYMVTSSSAELTIGPGRRLWGHTSSVACAHVGDRGKAVSVSKRGNELRVWELEGGMEAPRKKAVFGAGLDGSIHVRPESEKAVVNEASYLDLKAQILHKDEDMAVTKGWLAFDEEKVVVLREEQLGAQALVVYDFT